jgi:hypothetical protein
MEALRLVELIEEGKLDRIDEAIELNEAFVTVIDRKTTLLTPKHIAHRSGFYFLRAFDYLKNENIEVNIDKAFLFDSYPAYFIRKAPVFDVRSKAGMSAKTGKKEILHCIKLAKRNKHLIRIKYKNRNEELSVRTLRDFELVKGIKTPKYLVGFCELRQEERTFKVNRVQNVEELII